MNERNKPEFNAETIKRRLASVEWLMGKTLNDSETSLEIIASVVMQLARECNKVNDRPMK
jgi:hypothetical protein